MANKTGEELLQQQGQVAQRVAYIPSETVSAAETQLQDVSAGKPAEYTNAHADQLGGLYDQIVNRDPYSYNPMQDNVYMDYRNQYQQMGKQGAEAAQQNTRDLLGGYGSTWSQAAAGQQYGEHLRGMNDILPALEQNAFNTYQTEGNSLAAKLAATQAEEERDYGRWRDSYSNWAADRDYAQQRAQTEWQNDYSQYADNMNNVMQVIGWEREDAETVRQNAIDWVTTLIKKGIMPTQAIIDASGLDINYINKVLKKTGGGHGRRRKGGSGGGVDADTAATDGGSTVREPQISLIFGKSKTSGE